MITEKMILAGIAALQQCHTSEIEDISPKLYESYANEVQRVFEAMLKERSMPEGYILVPKNPSTVQWAAGMKAFNSPIVNKVDAVYRAMIGVVPDMNN